ncbi:MAG TPA: DUF3800 domain-containing protein [Gemmatimonadales bacterium]|nr:DUF3800 domain-containing protein [Gemmatimonadales bacterium]
MYFVFADDSRQRRPTRLHMRPFVSIGGVHVLDTAFRPLNLALERLCRQTGFPLGEEFKWSPRRGTWMHDNLRDEGRRDFFLSVLTVAAEHNVQVTVVIADSSNAFACSSSRTHEQDVTTMFLERTNNALRSANDLGIVFVDRPGGSRAAEERFVAECLETITTGTTYASMERILTVATATSHQARIMQLADVVTACVSARVAGEHTFSPVVFEKVKPLFRRDGERIGGVGLKIHPDLRYANLYHWLLGDNVIFKGWNGWPLPRDQMLYAENAGEAA